MNPITNNHSRAEASSGGYVANATRAIRALQEQMKELGKRLQDEVTNPTATGPEQQQLMRDLAQQMTSIRMELEALQESIIQHQTLAAFKKNQANERQGVQATQPVRPQPSDPSAPINPAQPEQSQGTSRRRIDKISALGTLINTTA